MNDFTPVLSTLGGVLIGLSSVGLLLFYGKIAGISGIAGSLLSPPAKGDSAWRIAFLLGLVTGGFAFYQLQPEAFAITIDRSIPALIVAGLLVGIGTRVGNGCTSGHGICGISRFSPRSLVATAVFIFTGMLSAFFIRHFFGGTI